MNLFKNKLKFGVAVIILMYFWCAHPASANVLYSQLDDSVELSSNNFGGAAHVFTGATGYPTEVRISYNDKGNGEGHFIAVGIVDADTGVTYYGYNPSISTPKAL